LAAASPPWRCCVLRTREGQRCCDYTHLPGEVVRAGMHRRDLTYVRITCSGRKQRFAPRRSVVDRFRKTMKVWHYGAVPTKTSRPGPVQGRPDLVCIVKAGGNPARFILKTGMVARFTVEFQAGMTSRSAAQDHGPRRFQRAA
jgi:hypothetical protein